MDPAGRGRPTATTRRWRWHIALVATVPMLLGAWALWLAAAQAGPWDGTRISGARFPESEWRDGITVRTVVDHSVYPGSRRDRVTAVDHEDIGSWIQSHRGDHFAVGDRLTYTVIHPDGVEEDLGVTLSPYGWGAAFQHAAAMLALAGTLFLVALVVVLLRPENLAARLLFVIAALIPFGLPFWPLKPQVLDLTDAPWPLSHHVVSGAVWALILGALIPHFILLFPSPPAPSPRRRRLIAVVYALPAVVYLGYLAITIPQAQNHLEVLERVSAVWEPIQAYAPFLIIALLAWTYRRTAGTSDRDRVTLVLAALFVAFAINIVAIQLPLLLDHPSLVTTPYWSAAFLLIPVALGVAIIQQQLFDITVALRRSVLGMAILAGVAGSYAAATWLLGNPSAEQARFLLLGALLGATVPVVYRRLRRAVEQRLYGARSQPLDLVARIMTVPSSDDPRQTLQRLADLLAESLRLPYAAVHLDHPPLTLSAVHGHRHSSSVVVDLTRDTDVIGTIELGVSPGREPFGAADRQLLQTIGAHTAATLNATLLTLALQESRNRLVASTQEERRRIRHDLHDGLQPSLVLLAMSLEVCKDLITTDSSGALDSVDKAHRQATEAIVEVRRIVSNLKPTILDELGLRDAVTLLCQRAEDATSRRAATPYGDTESAFEHRLQVTADIDLSADQALPAAVEVAAYRIVSEALTNVVRHADATLCTVHIHQDHGQDTLRIRVTDNGHGISDHTKPGTGQTSMHRRVAELDGTLDIGTAKSSGTDVMVTLPTSLPGTPQQRPARG
jgi:signal transduction histidine kinase